MIDSISESAHYNVCDKFFRPRQDWFAAEQYAHVIKFQDISTKFSKCAVSPLAFRSDSYPHVTNGDEKQDERPEASVCKESQPFQMVRQKSRPIMGACYFRPRPVPTVIVRGD
jgi:hypothetical protein